MSKEKDLQPHIVLREAYRHWYEFQELVKHSVPDPPSGKYGGQKVALNAQYGGLRDVIEFKGIELSFFDLERALRDTKLPDRKKEAFILNVIEDKLQREVADIMGISVVSVGQYVQQACLRIAATYFGCSIDSIKKGKITD